MKNLLLSWVFWALLSAGFAALTAIFAKIGIENVNSDFATFIRTVVILLVAALIVHASGTGSSRPASPRKRGCSSSYLVPRQALLGFVTSAP
jgi:uncharacterized membrane protein